MNALDRILPARGTSLLTGKPASWQNNVALELVVTHAIAGGVVIVLVLSKAEGNTFLFAVADWLKARKLPVTPLHVFPIVEPTNRTVEGYVAEIAKELSSDRPTLILRDTSRTAPGHDQLWNQVTRDLADTIGTTVFTVESEPFLYAKPDTSWADVVTTIETEAGINARLTPISLKGPTAKLIGKDHGSFITFNLEEVAP